MTYLLVHVHPDVGSIQPAFVFEECFSAYSEIILYVVAIHCYSLVVVLLRGSFFTARLVVHLVKVATSSTIIQVAIMLLLS